MTRGGRARLFVAVDLPGLVRESIAGWARTALGVGGPRLVGVQALHLTLCFLGARELAEVDAVADLALGCAAPVSDLLLGAPVWLPPRGPRAVALEVHDSTGALLELQAAVSEALGAGIGYEPESRRYRPHVTVARMRAQRPARAFELPATPALSFDAEALTLYRSWLEPRGARYEALASVALA